MKWHVLGVGAMGGLFACRLQVGGGEVTLLSRHDSARTRQLVMAGDPDERFQFAQELSSGKTHQLGDAPISHLLVCTKAWAAEDAVRSIGHRLSTDSVVIVLCNGMGLAQRIAPVISGATLVWASTTAGCWRAEDGRLVPAGAGETQLGADLPTEEPPPWLTDWKRGVPNCRWETKIHPTLLAKVAINAVINPLTAIHRVANGTLLTAAMKEETKRLTQEVQALLRAGGADQIAEALPARVAAVCSQTAHNHSSMRVDMERGQPTEIEAIAGWLLREWVDDPPPTPFLTSLYQTIRRDEALERRDSSLP